MNDIRWIQRYNNYKKALSRLENAVKLAGERDLTELEEQGLIQSFEYTNELAWKTLKDFFNYKGNKEIYGSKDASREAFKYGLIKEGEIWMDMITSRNNSSHMYNEETAKEIIRAIVDKYYTEFEKLKQALSVLALKE